MVNDYPDMSKPVVNLTWLEANRFSSWLSSTTGDSYSLPSEAEWMRSIQYAKENAKDFYSILLNKYQNYWFWTSDWFCARPSENISNPLLRGPKINSKFEWKVLKSLHTGVFERGVVIYPYRASNHSIVLIRKSDKKQKS